jgi:hypothetical protein
MEGVWDQRSLCQLLVALQCLSSSARTLLNLSGKVNPQRPTSYRANVRHRYMYACTPASRARRDGPVYRRRELPLL